MLRGRDFCCNEKRADTQPWWLLLDCCCWFSAPLSLSWSFYNGWGIAGRRQRIFRWLLLLPHPLPLVIPDYNLQTVVMVGVTKESASSINDQVTTANTASSSSIATGWTGMDGTGFLALFVKIVREAMETQYVELTPNSSPDSHVEIILMMV